MHLDFDKNLGPIDRLIRTFVGVFVISLVVGNQVPFWLFAIVVLFSLSLFIEALTGY